MEKFTGKLTLRNNFHNTTATVNVKQGIISVSSLKRARKKLCGMPDCACGDLRGPQDMIVIFDWDRRGEYAEVWEN